MFKTGMMIVFAICLIIGLVWNEPNKKLEAKIEFSHYMPAYMCEDYSMSKGCYWIIASTYKESN